MGLVERAAACPEYQALAARVKELRAQSPIDWGQLEPAIEAANARFRAIQDTWQAERDAETAQRREAFRGALDRYLAGFDPMSRGRREKSLTMLVRYNGVITERFKLAERLIEEGWQWDGEGLAGPGDRWMGPKGLTTFGLDYARWLSEGNRR